MKRLTITYDGITLYDADVDELIWSDSQDQVAVTGRRRKPAGAGALAGLGDVLARASRAKTQAVADKHQEDAADG